MELTTTEVIQELAKRRVIVTRRQVEYAIAEGHIPRPRKNSADNYCFNEVDLLALVKHFKQAEKAKKCSGGK